MLTPTVALSLPVGHYLGAFPDGGDWGHEVRRGDEVIMLTAPAFAGWLTATAATVPTTSVPTTTAPTTTAPTTTAPTAAGVLEDEAAVLRGSDAELRDCGLLVTVPADAEGMAVFAHTHRIMPLLLGLGPSTREPGGYAIGVPGRELVTVSPGMYRVWAEAANHATMWAACEAVDGSGTATLLAAVVGELPRLLAGFAAYLDTAARIDTAAPS